MRALLVLALVVPILAGCVGEPPSGVRDEFDPSVPHCVGECGRTVDDSAANAWEPFLAVNPSNPDHIVIAHSDGPNVVDADLALTGQTRVSVSMDGGVTWETHILPGGLDEGPTHPLAEYTHVGWQPSLAFLPDGTLVMSAMAAKYSNVPVAGRFWGSQTLYTTRSTDGGRTWDDVRIIDEGEGAAVFAVPPVGGKTMELAELAVGQDGTLLLVWVEKSFLHPDNGFALALGVRVVFSSSEDGGLTWGPIQIVDDQSRQYGPSVVVGRDGGWRIAYTDLDELTLHVAESKDRGATWAIRNVAEAFLKPNMRSQVLSSGAERLLLVYTTLAEEVAGRYQTEFTWSDDGGATWAVPLEIGMSQGHVTPLPNVAVARDDGAWITFFDAAGTGVGPARYIAVKAVAGVVSAPLVLDEKASPHFHYMGLGSTASGDALAAWTTDAGDGEHDLAWARITGGDKPVAQPIVLPVVPAGLDEPELYEFTGHLDAPDCVVEAPPGFGTVEHEFEVPEGTRYVNGTLSWTITGPTAEYSDLDLILYEPGGGYYDAATLAVPEVFSFEIVVGQEGTWTAWIQNCQNPPTDFTLNLELS